MMVLIPTLIFWMSLGWIASVYALYPALLLFLGTCRRKPQYASLPDRDLPSVLMLIPAYNEQDVISRKLENALGLDYPSGKLDILVVSDCSTDRTDAIAKGFAHRGVRFLRNTEQKGKIRTLSDLGAQAKTDIILITDANAFFAKDALRMLIAPFSDPRVGIVNGNRRLIPSASMAGEGEGVYWRYETMLKKAESDVFSNAFITGAMTAIRTSLFLPLPGYLEFDHVLPLHVVNQGYRVVFEERARFEEDTAPHANAEWRVRVRNAVRGFTMVVEMRRYLHLFRHPGFVLHVWLRKVLRWLIGIPALAALCANLLLLAVHPFYVLTLLGQTAFYATACAGWAMERRGTPHPLLALPFYFCLVNAASLVGLWRAVCGQRLAVWKTGRA
jgi:cellulose synthase/poly-beta-1,6-N-acetylglucosamine synthase-like glycosyltransferase